MPTKRLSIAGIYDMLIIDQNYSHHKSLDF